MMTKIEIEMLLEELDNAVSVLANTRQAKEMSAYMKSKFPFYGVKAPVRKAAVKDIMKLIRKLEIDDVIRIINGLWQMPQREMQMVAIDIGILNGKRWTINDLPFWLDIIKQKSWWDSVDGIASNIISSVMLNVDDNQRTILAKTWSKHEDLWIRRTSLIFQLKWKDQADEDLLFGLVDQVLHEEEFFIRKGAGWALRQLSKYKPESVSTYVEKRRDEMSNLTLREASKYL